MISFLSPAKINLFLEVVGKRPDGYHELVTLMQAVSLFDKITFSKAPSTYLTCNDSTLPLNHDNLVLKAHALFEKKSGQTHSYHIHLEKNIPHQAGLGGGSGNAATVLWALNQLSGTPFSVEQLMEWSAELGSDVPFFFSLGKAICSGRGERIQQLPDHQICEYTLVKPSFGLSTKDVFHALSHVNKEQSINNLEPAAFFVSPRMKEVKDLLLKSGYDQVTLTGSGSCFFCQGKGFIPQSDSLWSADVFSTFRKPGHWYTQNI